MDYVTILTKAKALETKAREAHVLNEPDSLWLLRQVRMLTARVRDLESGNHLAEGDG